MRKVFKVFLTCILSDFFYIAERKGTLPSISHAYCVEWEVRSNRLVTWPISKVSQCMESGGQLCRFKAYSKLHWAKISHHQSALHASSLWFQTSVPVFGLLKEENTYSFMQSFLNRHRVTWCRGWYLGRVYFKKTSCYPSQYQPARTTRKPSVAEQS